jgi:uncharacterized linocin/CFP29 family protein
MPIYQISYNDYDEVWETCRVDWEDETRALEAVAMAEDRIIYLKKEMEKKQNYLVELIKQRSDLECN